jgi:hypothetical protein
MKKLLFILFFAVAGLFTNVAVSHAQDYSVGSGYWSGYNGNNAQWQAGQNWNYNANWNNGSGNMNTSYNSTGWTDPRIVQYRPSEVRGDLYNVQTGQNVGVSTYTQSVTPHSFSTTVCATEYAGGRSQQVGCVPKVDYASAAEGVSQQNFNAWPSYQLSGMGGTHTIKWTYLDSMGKWRDINGPMYMQ